MSLTFPQVSFDSACHPFSTDPNYFGYSVDIALLQQDVTKIVESDAYIIQLSPIYLSYATFQAMFYRDSTFKPVKNLCDVSGASLFFQNKERTIKGGPFEDSSTIKSLEIDSSFNLLSSLLSVYQKDLGIDIGCWDSCSLIDFQKLITPITCLTDIIGCCNEGIKCSMTLDSFFSSLEAQGLFMDAKTGLPLDPFNNTPADVIYQGVVSANIIANFHSTTPGVKDLQIKWPFLINFNSYKGDPTPATNIWPHIYQTPAEVNRSDVFLITDVVTDLGVAVLKSGQFPDYNRYTAYQYSSIHPH